METETKEKLWDFLPTSEFKIPTAPTSEAARGNTRRFARWLKRKVLHRGPKSTDAPDANKAAPDAKELEAAAIAPDWHQPADALHTTLRDWLDTADDTQPTVRVLIGPPGTGIADTLHTLAEKHHLNVLAPPHPHALLNDPETHKHILQFLDHAADTTLLIPNLERFYLRHQDGLDLLRCIIERLATCRSVLLGCDSWAWAYLRHAAGIEDALGKPLAPAPFNDARLDNWFRKNYDLTHIEFRQIGDDKPVFPSCPDRPPDEATKAPPPTTTPIKALAAQSRGNLGVALALWRASLRTHNPCADDAIPTPDPAQTVYWVKTPTDFEPQLDTTQIGQRHRFVLHAILLHGGLTQSMLTALLPATREETWSAIRELQAAHILQTQGDTLHIAPTAYPEVRRDLHEEGFLTDTF